MAKTQFDISRLLVLRKLTRAVAESLGGELRGHLATLAPLLHPRNVFGEYVRGAAKQTVKGDHEAYEQLRGLYAGLARTAPFNLRSDLEAPVDIASVQPELTPAEYSHEAKGQEAKTIRITSPLKWTLSFTGFSPKRLRELLAPGFALERHSTYSRFFSEAVDTALNWGMERLGKKPSTKGMVVTRDDLDRHRKLFRVYGAVYPIVWALTRFDALVPASGYMLIATLKREGGGARAAS